jgi:hypothetical protein
MADVLKLETNVPQTIALAFAEGLTMPSKFGGDQKMFSLSDGRKWFTAPYIADKLKQAGVVAEQPFTICKREVVTGNRRAVEYQIETGSAATAPASQSTSQQAVQISQSHSIHAVPAPVALAAPVASASGFPIAPAATTPTVDTSASAIAFAGRAAVDAVLAVESYARQKGLTDFSFDGEQLSRIWISLYIDARKGGRA